MWRKPTCKVVRTSKGARVFPKHCKVRNRAGADGTVKRFNRHGQKKHYFVPSTQDPTYDIPTPNRGRQYAYINIRGTNYDGEPERFLVDTGAPGYISLDLASAIRIGVLSEVRARNGAHLLAPRFRRSNHRARVTHTPETWTQREKYVVSNCEMTLMSSNEDDAFKVETLSDIELKIEDYANRATVMLMGLKALDSLQIARYKFDKPSIDKYENYPDSKPVCEAVLRPGQSGVRIHPKGCVTDYKLEQPETGAPVLTRGRDGEKGRKLNYKPQESPVRWLLRLWPNTSGDDASTSSGTQSYLLLHDTGAPSGVHVTTDVALAMKLIKRTSQKGEYVLGEGASPGAVLGKTSYGGNIHRTGGMVDVIENTMVKLSDFDGTVVETVMSRVVLSGHASGQRTHGGDTVHGVVGLDVLAKLTKLRYSADHNPELMPETTPPSGWETI